MNKNVFLFNISNNNINIMRNDFENLKRANLKFDTRIIK